MPTKFDWYPADDEKVHFVRKSGPKQTKLREGVVAGTVLIILSGRFRGKRVVFLKQLDSGLLLVTGPYKINGVPLRRVNQAYTIATSTVVDVSGVKTDQINDEFFAKDKAAASTKEAQFFTADNYKKSEITAVRKAAQKTVDAAILTAIKKDAFLGKYLNARFSLTKNMKPHAMKF